MMFNGLEFFTATCLNWQLLLSAYSGVKKKNGWIEMFSSISLNLSPSRSSLIFRQTIRKSLKIIEVPSLIGNASSGNADRLVQL